MRMRIVNVFRTVGRWAGRLLAVRLPMDIVSGLRTH
jgi:hypothetical protein